MRYDAAPGLVRLLERQLNAESLRRAALEARLVKLETWLAKMGYLRPEDQESRKCVTSFA